MTRILYKAPRTLSRFMDSDAFVRAIVGPVGSGKSSACCLELLVRAMRQEAGPDGVRRSRWAVIRNTYPELRDTTRKTFEQWIPPGTGKWNEQQFTFTIDRELPDGTRLHVEVLFRALDRPDDTKKLLSLELTGAYINEARQVPKSIFDVLQSRVGRYPSKLQGGPTWFGIWMDTNPWHTNHWGYKLFTEGRPEGFELYEQPGGRTPDAENVDNLPPGYYERLCLGKDAEWVGEYVDSKYPNAARGSVYGHLMAALKGRGGIADFKHPTDGVFTNWDLGISDSMAIWFWRLGKDGVDVIDHYEGQGEAFSHYMDVVDGRGYQYVKHWLPHDARARTLTTGASVLDQALKRWPGQVAITPELGLSDGIAAGRWLLEPERRTRFHVRCSAVTGPNDIDGLEALAEYRYDYDEERDVNKKTPIHDWTSHSADAWRYVACVVKASEVMSRPAEKPPPKVHPGALVGASVDDIFTAHFESVRGRR